MVTGYLAVFLTRGGSRSQLPTSPGKKPVEWALTGGAGMGCIICGYSFRCSAAETIICGGPRGPAVATTR